MKHLAVIMRIVEHAIADLLAVNLVNAERLAFLDLERAAIGGRYDKCFS